MPGPCMPTSAADRQRAVPCKRVDLPSGGMLLYFDRSHLPPSRPRGGFATAQRIRIICLDALELAERIEAQPTAGTDGVEDRVAAIEELALQMWEAGRGRRPIGWE